MQPPDHITPLPTITAHLVARERTKATVPISRVPKVGTDFWIVRQHGCLLLDGRVQLAFSFCRV